MSSKNYRNRSRYARCPTNDEIKLVIEHIGVSIRHFEEFFNMPPSTIRQVLTGARVKVKDNLYDRKLPVKFWHIIFENLPPAMLKGDPAIKPKEEPKRLPKFKRANRKKIKIDEKIMALL